ncbi:MAG: hypothetical protein KDC87_09515 [Planctomycetes bacterium]|nr:hypothetical protein [Planctomycetota bacterium]MCB9888804.1 hypothetical protein [Planctomycetota bacterium]
MRYTLACIALLCPVAVAQSFTSPKGFDTTEAGSAHGFSLASATDSIWQQIDSSLHGGGFTGIKSIAFRRDGALAANAAYVARTLKSLSVTMSHATLAAATGNLSGNYKGTPTTVFPAKDVSAPDWTAAPSSSPMPFSLSIPFATTWSYNGTDDLLWEVAIQAVQTAPTALVSYPFDFQRYSGAFQVVAGDAFIGQGCRVSGMARNFVLSVDAYNHGTKFRLRHSVNYGPASADIVSFVDAVDPNQSIPGLCAALHVNPLVWFPMGRSSTGGSVPGAFLDIPYLASAVGQRFYMQAVGQDPTQSVIPLAVTQGVQVTVPIAPVLPAVGYVYSEASSGVRTYSGPWGGGIVARFEHN